MICIKYESIKSKRVYFNCITEDEKLSGSILYRVCEGNDVLAPTTRYAKYNT